MNTWVAVILAGLSLGVVSGADAVEKKTQQTVKYLTVRQLVKNAKDVTADVFGGVSASVRLDGHDLVVEFRVLEGDQRLRDALIAYIETVSDHGERNKVRRDLYFNPDSPCVLPLKVEEVFVACGFYKWLYNQLPALPPATPPTRSFYSKFAHE